MNDNIYEYVAMSDEYGSRAILNKYGYSTQNADTPEGLGECLRQLVAQEGEPALMDILAIHPDKDAIIEAFGTTSSDSSGTCNCKKGKIEELLNSAKNEGNTIAGMQPSSLLLIGGVILLSLALIVKS